MAEEEKKEKLAEYAHNAWAEWMKYLFTKGKKNEDGTFTINKDSVERWERQMTSSYTQLPENERKSDRVEAQRMLDIINGK